VLNGLLTGAAETARLGLAENAAPALWPEEERAVSDSLRRLSDKILAAFNQACEQRQVDTAEHLLRALELSLTRYGGKNSSDKRGDLGPVVEAFGRLEALRQNPIAAVANK
jgi:hypothetical protein